MSVDWKITPLVPRMHQWLKSQELAIKNLQSRYPTLEELISVLETFNLPIQKEKINETLIGIGIGEARSLQYMYIVGMIENNSFNILFVGSMCNERKVLGLLKILSQKYCSPLLIYYASMPHPTPIVVHSELDIEKSFIEWQEQRFNERHFVTR